MAYFDRAPSYCFQHLLVPAKGELLPEEPIPSSIQSSCPICYSTYVSLATHAFATDAPDSFGILQCGACQRDLCRQCYSQLQHPRKCPTCRKGLTSPQPVRVMQELIYDQPASCKWAACKQTGLTIGTLQAHQRECVHKVMMCECGFSSIVPNVHSHQRACIPHHIRPLQLEIKQLQAKSVQGDKLRHLLEDKIDECQRQNLALTNSNHREAAAFKQDIVRLEARIAKLEQSDAPTASPTHFAVMGNGRAEAVTPTTPAPAPWQAGPIGVESGRGSAASLRVLRGLFQ